jgi:hypothetical protein
LNIDFNHLWDDIRQFFQATRIVLDCPINQFMDFRPLGRASRLLSHPEVPTRTNSGAALEKVRASGKPITCRECGRIGDAVIALEQPRSMTLIHIDRDFDVLCDALERPHRWLPSERTVENGVPGTL